MASIDLEYNSGFQIYNSDGTPFHDLVLHKCTYETVVMSLGDKISGILYYKDNALDVTMSEYIMYKGVRYTLVNPPTILREGLVSDNSELRGMTKYSFTFYHPMYVLNNFPFSDIAVQSGQSRYLSQNKTFSWIGTLVDFVAKLNKNLEDTQWMVTIGNVTQEEQTKLSEVLSFDKNTIAEALKRGYETWEVPYVVDQVAAGTEDYQGGKRFVVQYGLPTTEILDEHNQPFVFQMGQGVGLKNNSRNPKNNKIITRIAGYGSEDNIPYGYPQIPYYGGNVQYPLYYGIVGGQRVQLIKHPFTRNHLMPSVYSQSVYNKVNPKLPNGNNNPNYDPTIELVDYYDANDNTYTNRIKPNSPSYEIHEFGDIKPELGEKSIISAVPVSQQETQPDYKQKSDFLQEILDRISATEIEDEKTELLDVYDRVDAGLSYYEKHGEEGGDTYWFVFSITRDDYYEYVSYESSNYNFTATMLRNGSSAPTPDWDDTMDDDGNYLQSYFKITLPTLEFDLYACAAITQEMKINMRSGACIGCTFPVEVDWDDYKRNFYNSNGEFDPDGEQRDYTKYPDSSSGQITIMVKKELETFGTLMPNQYQQPTTGDKFVILGISLPNTYITSAEQRLDTDMKQHMRDNNVYYYDYPLKFDEHFLINHENILSQMKNNVVVKFRYADEEQPKALYIKQMSVKYNESPLPKYDITLTDDIEIVLNQIGQVTDEVSKLRLGFGAGGFGSVGAEYIRKDIDDTARGTIRMIKGMQVGERFVTGLLGEGGVFRKDSDGTTYLETDKLYVRMKAYFDTVEVKHYLHTGGNRIASQASGIVCSRVEMIDAHNNLAMDVADAVLFRCFFKANDGDKTIRNDFMIGDLAFCRETNVDVSSVNLHGYWRLVIGRNSNGSLTENKEGWIDLSNRASETLTIGGVDYVCNGYQNGSDAPIAQDDIIQLGNIVDKDRQGAIVEYVGGEDAPSYQIFQGIGEDLPYPYTLEDKNYIGLGYSSQTGHAYMNVYGDVFIGAKPDAITGESPTYIKYEQEDPVTGEPKLTIKAVVEFQSPDDPQTTTTLDDFARLITGDIENIQSQIDGEIDTWFYAGIPTLQNAPANEWTTDAEKEKHTGDLYYDIGTGADAGKAYRFVRSQTTPYVYSWQYIDDTAITEALRIAAHAQDTADGKRRVFLTIPTPPYDEGDLWANAVYPANYDGRTDEEHHKYNNDLLRAKKAVPRTEGGQEITTFSINDWELATKYTDDSSLIDFIDNTYTTDKTNLQQQIDGKAETWYQDDDPSSAWTTASEKAKHIGDLWSDTSANGGKKTYIWKDFGTSANPRYAWAEQAVPDEVFDKIDGKSAIYTNTFAAHPVDYSENDLWILPAAMTINGTNYKRGEVLTATRDYSGTNTWQADWTKKVCYTDNTELFSFIKGAYAKTIQSLNDQIDQKANTYYQDTDPSLESGWDASEHVGDLWYNTTDSTTWYYKDNGASASPRYSWVEQDVPDSVFDKIDGKSSIFVTQPSNYKANDLWILAADTTVNKVAYKQGEVLTASQDSQSYNQSHWSKKVRYTDDSSLTTFLNGTYSTDKANLQTQIDQKAETWYQSTDPSLAWTTPDLRTLHVGDLWHNSSNSTVSNIEAGMDAMWNGTSWVPSEVPQDVYDKIDGKADIFVSKPTTYNRNDLWIIESGIAAANIPSGCQAGDIVIADNMPSGINSRGSYVKGDWRKKDRYTDDSYAHEFDYLKTAMKGDTSIQGGLLLSNTIVLRNLDTSTTPATITDIMSGINGVLNTSLQNPLKSIAAWYGGAMTDHEASPSVSNYAKSLFRFDGSGYLASGNITWDDNGIVTIANVYADVNGVSTSLSGSLQTLTNLSNALPLTIVSGTTYLDPQYSFSQISVRGKAVATQEYVSQNYISIAFFNRLFQAYSSTTISDANKVAANDTTTAINNLKILVGTWTNEYLTALGLNSSGSGGGGSSTLAGLNDVTLSLPQAGQSLVYRNSHWVNEFITQGTVTSVSMSVPEGFLVSPSTISTTGTFAISFGGSIAKNKVLASPSTAAGAPSWRVLVAADIPNLAASKITSGTFNAARIPDLSATYATSSRVTTLEGYFTDGVAKSAAKLSDETAYKAWGQTFFTGGLPTSVTGNMSGVGTITFNGANAPDNFTLFTAKMANNDGFRIVVGGSTSDSGYAELATYDNGNEPIYARQYGSSNVLTNSMTLLDASGNTVVNNLIASSYIKIGDIYIGFDSGNQALEVYKLNGSTHVAANFYARGAVSALGANTSSSGGGGGDVYWSQLTANNSSTGQQIHSSHLSSVTNPLSLYFNEETQNPNITYDGKNNRAAFGILTKSYADGRYVRSVKYNNGNPITPNSNGVVDLGTIASNRLVSVSNPLDAYVFQIKIGQPTVGTSTGNAYAGSSSNYNLWSYPNGMTGINDNNTANIQNIRYTWNTEYFRDIFMSPNNTHLFHRNVQAGTAGDWYVIPQYKYVQNAMGLGSATKPVYINSDGKLVEANSYPTTLPASDVYAWAKAATKPSYAFSEITGSLTATDIPNLAASKITSGTFDAARIPDLDWSKITGTPTTLSGYGITDGVKDTTTWWGASIDANGAVKGSMSNVDNIAFSASGKNIGGLLYFNTTNSQIKIGSNATLVQYTSGNGTFTPKLYVDGYAGVNGRIFAEALELVGSNASVNKHGGYIDFHYSGSTDDYTGRIIEKESGLIQLSTNIQTSRIYLYKPNSDDTNAVYLECDANHNVKLVGNFYATGAVSALGLSNGSSGIVLSEPLSTINSSGLSAPTVNGSVLVYSNNAWKYSSNAGIFATDINIAGSASATGFYATGKNNTYVLLGGGGTSKLKTINGNSIFGEGDITISVGGSNDRLVPVASPLSVRSIYAMIGQPTIGTADGNAYEGSSNNANLWSYPAGGTPTSTIANIQNIRIYWGATYFTDFFTSPNNNHLFHRSVINDTAGDWYVVPQYKYVQNAMGLGSATKPVYINSDGKLVEANSYPSTLDNIADGTTRKLADYLPLSGGTITSTSQLPLTLNTSANHNYISFKKDGDNLGYIGYYPTIGMLMQRGSYYIAVRDDGVLAFHDGTSPRKVWHAGNMGHDSGLNADTLDGRHGSEFIRVINYKGNKTYDANAMSDTLALYISGGDMNSQGVTTWSNFPTAQPAGSIGLLNIHEGNYSAQFFTRYGDDHFYYRHETYTSSRVWYSWGKVAFISDIPTNTNQLTNGAGFVTASIVDGYATQTWVGQNYLSLGGGTMSNTDVVTDLNADRIDNYHASSFVIDAGGSYAEKIYSIPCKRVFSGNNLSDAPATGWVSGIALGSNWNSSHYQHYLVEVGSRWYATRTYSNGSMTTWNTFAYLSDNVASATKLQNSRNLWGQPFNGTADVTGAMSGVTNIDSLLYLDTTNSRVGIGTSSPSQKLHVVGRVVSERSDISGFDVIRGDYKVRFDVNGSNFGYLSVAKTDGSASAMRISMSPVDSTDPQVLIPCNLKVGSNDNSVTDGSYVQIGGVRLVYHSDSSSLEVVKSDGSAANFYATGAVSALGANTSSGGGGGDVTWTQLTADNPSTGQQIHPSHLSGVTEPLYFLFNEESSPSITYNGRANRTVSGILTKSYADNMYVKQSGNATISGTATIGGYMTIGATVAVGAVNSQVIQTLDRRAIYIKTGSAPNYVDGTWSNTSDVRLKDIINNVGASVDQIANAPIFNYKWKSGGVSIMLGSSAQYWQKVFQYAVEIGPENYLYMDYSSVALASAVMVARRVQNHEDRILELERENMELREEIKQLKAA